MTPAAAPQPETAARFLAKAFSSRSFLVGFLITMAIATSIVTYKRNDNKRIETMMNKTLIVAPLMLLSTYLLFDHHEKIGRLRLELDEASP